MAKRPSRQFGPPPSTTVVSRANVLRFETPKAAPAAPPPRQFSAPPAPAAAADDAAQRQQQANTSEPLPEAA